MPYAYKNNLIGQYKNAVDSYNTESTAFQDNANNLQTDVEYLNRLFTSTGRNNNIFDLSKMLGLGTTSFLEQNLKAMPLLSSKDPVAKYFALKKNDLRNTQDTLTTTQSDLQNRYNTLAGVKDLPSRDKFGHDINYDTESFLPVENKYTGTIGDGDSAYTVFYNSLGQRVNSDGSIYVEPVENYYASGGPVEGPGTATSDSILARLSDGEYVLDAETVKLLGGGSTEKGWSILDLLRSKLKRG